MSNFLNFAGNQGVTFKNHGTGGGTSFTLDVSASTNSVLLTVGGVLQAPGTDYTVSGTTITTTSSVTAGIEVLSWVVHKPGTAPVIQDNSVTGAKIALASQAQGDLMYFNGTSWVRLAKGTAAQLLAMNSGATAPEWIAFAGSPLEVIQTQAVSAAAQADFVDDGSWDDYDTLIFELSSIYGSVSNAGFRIRISDDTGSTFKTGASDYQTVWHGHNSADVGFTHGNNGYPFISLHDDSNLGGLNASGSQTGGDSWTITVTGRAAGEHVNIGGTCRHFHKADNRTRTGTFAGTYITGTQAIDGFRFYASSGNIYGRLTLYGLKNA